MDSIQERVQRGATLLDRHRPEWWKIINLDELRMHNTCNCVLGQCYGAFNQGKLALELTKRASDDADNGFEANEKDGYQNLQNEYQNLQNEWVRVITERRQQETASA